MATKVLYMSTFGTGDPTKASIPWHLAVNGSLESGQEVVILLAGDASEILSGERRETLEGVGLPPLRELVAKARDRSVPVHV